jgi:hypothetical protein
MVPSPDFLFICCAPPQGVRCDRSDLFPRARLRTLYPLPPPREVVLFWGGKERLFEHAGDFFGVVVLLAFDQVNPRPPTAVPKQLPGLQMSWMPTVCPPVHQTGCRGPPPQVDAESRRRRHRHQECSESRDGGLRKSADAGAKFNTIEWLSQHQYPEEI